MGLYVGRLRPVLSCGQSLPIREYHSNNGGQWTEICEIEIGSEPARKFMELKVSRLK